MTDCYYDSPEVARLLVLLDEATRARPGSAETRFILPEGGLMDRLESRFHHVVYGRRGTGKSSLLRRSENRFADRGSLTAWADQETYMALSYPDVLVGTLGDVFAQFAKQLRAAAPSMDKKWWQRAQPTEHEVVAAELEQLVAQLLDLKRAPSEAAIEWTVTSSRELAATLTGDVGGQVSKGPVQTKASRSRSTKDTQAAGSGMSQKYTANKTDHLEKALTSYRAMMSRVTALVPDAFVILDDFYRLASDDQPRIAGYFHRAVKDTGVWLKFGTIRYWTRLYAGGQPAMGLQAPHDVIELSLDRGLLDFKASKKFLEQILGALATECEVDIPMLFSDGALDRLVLAAGGVPRDYIGLVSGSIAAAISRGPSAKSGSERVIAEDVNEAAGRTVETKFNDLNEDAGQEAADLRELVIKLTTHCRNTRSACFLVDFRKVELVNRLNRLQTMRFVHAIDDNETLPDPQSSRYNVYVLDVSQLAAQRAANATDFMGWVKRENRRARKLVFDPDAAEVAATPRPSSAKPKPAAASSASSGIPIAVAIEDQLPFEDDEAAVIGEIDPPVGNPNSDGSITPPSYA